jgi:hypothetical protein
MGPKKRKQFLFEKKNQKPTLSRPALKKKSRKLPLPQNFLSAGKLNIVKSFLLLFFKKEVLLSFRPFRPPGRWR